MGRTWTRVSGTRTTFTQHPYEGEVWLDGISKTWAYTLCYREDSILLTGNGCMSRGEAQDRVGDAMRAHKRAFHPEKV